MSRKEAPKNTGQTVAWHEERAAKYESHWLNDPTPYYEAEMTEPDHRRYYTLNDWLQMSGLDSESGISDAIAAEGLGDEITEKTIAKHKQWMYDSFGAWLDLNGLEEA